MAVVHYRDFAKLSVPATDGFTLLETSLVAKLPHFHQCRATARCTTCRVRVLDGAENLSPRTGAELQIATERGWPEDVRLGCQARVLGEVAIERLVRDEEAAGALLLPGGPERQGEDKRVAVMFCDLRNFTRLTARHLAHDVIHILNRFLHAACEPVLANRGYLDKYLGDGFLAVFGLDGSTSCCLDAARAAMRIPERVAALNRSLDEAFGLTLDFGVGLHYGEVVVGDMGHPQKTQFTVLGDTVNVASRIEGLNKRFGTRVLASAAFVRQVCPGVQAGPRRRVSIAGRWEAVHEITGIVDRDRHWILQRSADRILRDPHRFGRLFYEALFRAEPAIEPLFTEVNMERMREMLLHMLDQAVRHIDDLSALARVLGDLGARHAGYGVRTDYYPHARKALLAAIVGFFGNEADSKLQAAWADMFDGVTTLMLDGTRQPEIESKYRN